MVRDIPRPRQKVGVVKYFDPRIDSTNSLDVLGLERRRDQHDERACPHRAI